MSAIDHDAIEALLTRHGVPDFRWLHPSDIATAHWVRMKCVHGCPEFGHRACCPPNTPPVAECRAWLDEYQHALILHFARRVERPELRHAWTREVNTALLALEREVFLAGHPKAFLLYLDSCNLCEDCAPRRAGCKEPMRMRPSPEAMAIDVFGTARKAGLPIQVLRATDEEMNRYAFLLVA
jgi:predicted metal-binding protein